MMARKKTRRKSDRFNSLASILIGLLIGLGLGAIFYLYKVNQTQVNQNELPYEALVELAATPESNAIDKAEQGETAPAESQSAPVNPAAKNNHKNKEKTETKAKNEKPRFEFYSLLPEMEVILPEQDLAIKEARERHQKSANQLYLIQTGSFRRLKDADSMKARLLLLGLKPFVQTITVDNKKPWYRVRLGPFKKGAEFSKTRNALKRNFLDFLLIKTRAQKDKK